MGKATRWLKGFLGMKRDKENMENNSNCGEKKEKKRWSFAKSGKNSCGLTQIPEKIQVTGGSWMRSYIDEKEKEQNKHAIAVAAATAAVADAAVAAAEAAVAVVRLTSQGRGALFHGGIERWAAVKIQTVFRGFLARKALRALRGLVKLQALVRGFLVRKRAAATLYSMEALIRAQAAIRRQRARRSISNDYQFQPELRVRKYIDGIHEFHSKRISVSRDLSHCACDENPKIVEVDDSDNAISRSRRINPRVLEPTNDQYYREVLSPRGFKMPNHVSTRVKDLDWSFMAEDYKFTTAHSTPRFGACGRADLPSTPTKSVCGDRVFRPYSNCPNYMSNTQSFRAKLRSLSAPKQRPDVGSKKWLSLDEIMASRSSFSGVRMHKSCSRVKEDFD